MFDEMQPKQNPEVTPSPVSFVNPSFVEMQPKTEETSDQPIPDKTSPLTSENELPPSPVFVSPRTSDEELPYEALSLRIVSDVVRKAEAQSQGEPKQHETPIAILPVSHHTSISEESLVGRAKTALEEDENKQDEPTEKSPLIKNGTGSHPVPEYQHTHAYEKLTSAPSALDPEDPTSKERRHKIGEDASYWLCCTKVPLHPITSHFTNENFRQAYTGEIFKVKANQILVCFLVSITSQLFWGWDWNLKMGTPAYVLRVEEHRWVTAIPLSLYVIQMGFIRLISPREARSWPFNVIFHIVSTFFLCLLTFMLSVGFGDIIYSGLVPVTLGSLYFAHCIFRRLIIAESDEKYRLDVTTRGAYYAIPPLISAGAIISWPIVFLLLWATNSAVGAIENIGVSLLFEGIPAIPIGGLVLLVSSLLIPL